MKAAVPILRLLSLLGLLTLPAGPTLATTVTFTDIGANLPEVHVAVGSSPWGDFDADGDLDVLLTGCGPAGTDTTGVLLLRNDGSGSFVPLSGLFEGTDPSVS